MKEDFENMNLGFEIDEDETDENVSRKSPKIKINGLDFTKLVKILITQMNRNSVKLSS